MKSLSKKIDERVRIQIRNQIGLVLVEQVNTNVRRQVTDLIQIEIWGQVNNQVWIRLSDRLHRQLSNPHKQNRLL